MLVIAANTCIFQTFTLFTVDIPRCLAMFPILLLLEPLFGSSLTKIRREISKIFLVSKISKISDIICPMSMPFGIATQKYISKNLRLPIWKFIREGCSKEVRSIFTTQTYSEAQNQFFPLPQHPKNNSNLQIEKVPVSPTPYRKLTFFGTYLPLGWAIPFFSKHLMTFNNPNLTIYLLWSS